MNSFFGIGIMELFFIAILAMIVLGPERLPGLIREGAKWMRQIRRLTSDLTSQFSEEMKTLDEINPQRIMRELTDPEEAEQAKKAQPAAKASAAAATKPAAKPAPAKTTATPAKTAAPKATTPKVAAAAAATTSVTAPAAQDSQPPAADSAPPAGVATAADASSLDVDNRILPPQGEEAGPPPEQPAVSGAAPSPKPTIGDPRPLMARNAAQKAEKNGAPSVAAVNGDEGQTNAPSEPSTASSPLGQVATPANDVVPKASSAVADGKPQPPEGDA